MDREAILNMDPHMLISILNLKLRDYYSSLDMLCDDMNISKDELKDKLSIEGYLYKEDINQFR